jgi:hypothetical protein
LQFSHMIAEVFPVLLQFDTPAVKSWKVWFKIVAVIPRLLIGYRWMRILCHLLFKTYNSFSPIVYKDLNTPVMLRHVLQQISRHVSSNPSEFHLRGVRCQLVAADFFETSAIRRHNTRESCLTVSNAFEALHAQSAADITTVH